MLKRICMARVCLKMAEEVAVPNKRLKLDNCVESCVSISAEIESSHKVAVETSKEGTSDTKKLDESENLDRCSILVRDSVAAKGEVELEAPAKPNYAAPSKLSTRQVTEEGVGILEYIGTHKGFYGVLKQRYVDFVVKERDLNGRLVQLTCTDLPTESRSDPSDPKTEEVDGEVEGREHVLNDEEMSKIRELAETQDKTASVTISLPLETEHSKEYRTRVHQAIKSNFPMLDSETVTTDANTKAIRVCRGRSTRGNRKQAMWPHNGNYCVFVLYKENKDTMDAINLLTKLLKLNTKVFAYAGTKDRRAVTAQQVSAYKVSAERLQGLNRTLKNLCLGNFRYAKEPLQLGDLSGNHFIVTLRSVTGTDEDITKAMLSLENNGFINYYGLQRFGSTSVPTHHIGRAILSCKWEEVVDLILRPRSDDQKDLAAAREYWAETKDPRGTLNKIPRQKCLESKLLEGLIKHCAGSKNDFLGALQTLPRNMRLMYVHAYQSYIWNCIVSRRIKEYGLKPVVGDLVPVSNPSLGEHDANDTKNEIDMEDIVCSKENVNNRPSRIKVRPLTEEDLNSDTLQYSIYDVVMPLPGYDVIYPGNSMKEWYRELMSKDDLDIDKMRHKVKDYSLSGAYRSLLMKPKHFQWRLLRYNDALAPLVLTDLDRLKGKVLDPGPLEEGKLRALQMEFTLSPSCYATMALREVLKCSTSSQYQSSLNS